MEKYGTYRIFKNTVTGEVVRIPSPTEELEATTLEKVASAEDWKEIYAEED